MQLTINISNEQLFEKILWFLNSFKNEGLEIVSQSYERPEDEQKKLTKLQTIIDFKSPNAIPLDKDTLLNPHNELSNDIS